MPYLIHAGAVSKPANAAVWNELMHLALNVDTEGIPRKPRFRMELSVRAVQPLDIVGVRIPRRPHLRINNIGEDLLARRMNGNFVMSKQVCLLRVKAVRPMYILRTLLISSSQIHCRRSRSRLYHSLGFLKVKICSSLGSA